MLDISREDLMKMMTERMDELTEKLKEVQEAEET